MKCESCSNCLLDHHCKNQVPNLLPNTSQSKPVKLNDRDSRNSLEQHLYIRITPEKRKNLLVLRQNNFSSPLQTISESCPSMELSATEEHSCTPLKDISEMPSNPFDVDIDSLHLPSFSPSVFATFHTEETERGKSFRWSIDQLAVLNPVNIDETSVQDMWVDSDQDKRAQRAIDIFFSRSCIVPSPSGSTPKHVTFSPNLASTAYFSHHVESNTPSEALKSPSSKEVCTQTLLTIPPDLDVMSLLGRYFTFNEALNNNDSSSCSLSEPDMLLSTSNLRRKLFFSGDGCSSTPSRIVKEDELKFTSSILPRECTTPKGKINEWCVTPSSDHFSSSPITPRNCSISINCAGHSIASPSLSPIRSSSAKFNYSGPCSRFGRRIFGPSGKKQKEVNQGSCKKNSSSLCPIEPINVPSTEAISSVKAIVESSECCNNGNCTQEMVSQNESKDSRHGYLLSIIDSCSQQQDTGYQTNSVNSVPSMNVCPAFNLPSHVTPVAEMVDHYISRYSIKFNEISSAMSLDQSELHYHANDDSLSDMVVNQDTSSNDVNLITSIDFSNLKWKQNVCSTPTKAPRY